MKKMRVARRPYHRMSPDTIGKFALGVRDGVFILYPSRFPSPPMNQTAFEKIIQTYQDNRSAYVKGGLNQKGPYTEAKDDLMQALDDFADMVDGIPKLTSAIVMEGGFVPVKESRSKRHAPSGGTASVKLTHGSSAGVIHAECSVVPEGAYYHAIVSIAPLHDSLISTNGQLTIGNQRDVVFIEVTKQRLKVFEGLMPGTVYYVYFYIGNTRGVSQLTNAATIMCV